MKKFFSLFAAALMAVSMMAMEEIAVATFNGKNATYTEGWTTTGTGVGRTDCVVIGAGEKITSPEFDFSEFSKVYVAFSGRRYGSLTGSKATVNVAVNGVSVGTIDIKNGSVAVVTDTLMFSATSAMTDAVLEFTCTNATSAGSSHGAGIGQITILGETSTGGGGDNENESDAELLCNLTFPDHNDSNVGSYTSNWTATVDGQTWTIVNFNNNNSGWNLIKCGSKSAASVASITSPAFKANVTAIVYNFAAVASVESAYLYTLNGETEIAKTPVTLTAGKDSFAIENGQSKYSYKLEINCAKASANGPVQLSSVKVYGTPIESAVADPVFDLAAGSYYDPQTIHLTCETEGVAFFYTTDGSTPTSASSLYYPQYGISLAQGTTTTIKAITYNNDSDNPQYSEVVEKTYTIATIYDSFDELVTEAGAPADQKVVVNFENVVIDSLYTSKAGKVNGVYVTAAERMVEIYCYDVPEAWAVGGTISGTVKGEWKEYLGTWEVCPSSWDGITYKAVLPEGPAITVDAEEETFTITPANEQDIYMFMLLNPSYPGVVVSKDYAEMMAETMVSEICADWTLADYVEEGLAYKGALEDIPFSAVASLSNGVKYALVAFTLAENDATLHTAEITSKITYVEFTIERTSTGVENTTAVKAIKSLENGQVVIIREGVRYNVMGAKF